MMEIKQKIAAFAELGKSLVALDQNSPNASADKEFWQKVIDQARVKNPWFTTDFTRKALANTGLSLSPDRLDKWIEPYAARINRAGESKTIGVVNAGNIPAVGFHDFLCVLFSGHRYLGKLSSSDPIILPALAEKLVETEPGFKGQFNFTQERLSGFDAVIATGSNNTSRYFEYYFGKYPHIIRKNRNGVAVLSGAETTNELRLLGRDVFLYYGMGCRNVSKLFVPIDYEFEPLIRAFEDYAFVVENHKYKNNYDYHKAIFLVNLEKHLDTGFLLLKEAALNASPLSVLHYEKYADLREVKEKISLEKELIQCVVGKKEMADEFIPFGTSQRPELWDYADGVDTMEFLLSLTN